MDAAASVAGQRRGRQLDLTDASAGPGRIRLEASRKDPTPSRAVADPVVSTPNAPCLARFWGLRLGTLREFPGVLPVQGLSRDAALASASSPTCDVARVGAGVTRVFYRTPTGLTALEVRAGKVLQAWRWQLPSAWDFRNAGITVGAILLLEKKVHDAMTRTEYETEHCHRLCRFQATQENTLIVIQDSGTGVNIVFDEGPLLVPREFVRVVRDAAALIDDSTNQSTNDFNVGSMTIKHLSNRARLGPGFLESTAYENDNLRWYWDNDTVERSCTDPDPLKLRIRRCSDPKPDVRIHWSEWIDPNSPDKLETWSLDWNRSSDRVHRDSITTKGYAHNLQDTSWANGKKIVEAYHDKIKTLVDESQVPGVDVDVRIAYDFYEDDAMTVAAYMDQR